MGAQPSPENPLSRTLAFIAAVSVGGVLRVVVEQENAPESNRAGRDNTDGGLYFDPENIPYVIVHAYESYRDSAD